MTEEEQKLFRLYGKLPAKKNVVKNNLKVRLPSSPPSAPTCSFTPLADV